MSTIAVSAVCSGSLSGQCSEVCGSFHGYMPISVLVIASVPASAQMVQRHVATCIVQYRGAVPPIRALVGHN